MMGAVRVKCEVPDIEADIAVVYQIDGAGRRYLTKDGVFVAAAWRVIREAYPCECERGNTYEDFGDYGEYWCGCNSDDEIRLAKRLARWIGYRYHKAALEELRTGRNTLSLLAKPPSRQRRPKPQARGISLRSEEAAS